MCLLLALLVSPIESAAQGLTKQEQELIRKYRFRYYQVFESQVASVNLVSTTQNQSIVVRDGARIRFCNRTPVWHHLSSLQQGLGDLSGDGRPSRFQIGPGSFLDTGPLRSGRPASFNVSCEIHSHETLRVLVVPKANQLTDERVKLLLLRYCPDSAVYVGDNRGQSTTDPPGTVARFNGDWATMVGTLGYPIALTLTQAGNQVTGSYTHRSGSGTLTGKVVGDTLYYTWSERGQTGTGQFRISRDGQQIRGSFTEEGKPDNIWSGRRLK